MNRNKPKIRCAIVGHPSSGISTFVGHVLVLCGGIDKRTIEKMQREFTDMGRPGSFYRNVINYLKDQRERGITIEINLYLFATKNFTCEMLVEPTSLLSTRPEAMIILVSASRKEFNSKYIEFILGQALIARCIGANLIIGINKMDEETVNYEKNRFNELKDILIASFSQIGFDYKTITFIPMSTLIGENLLEKSEKMKWYLGPSFVEALDNTTPLNLEKLPLRLPISNVYKIASLGTVLFGKVESGIMQVGQMVTLSGSNITCKVESMEAGYEAVPGDEIGFRIRNVDPKEIKRGCVCGDAKNKPTESSLITVMVSLLSHANSLRVGESFMLHCQLAKVEATLVEIIHKLGDDKNSLKKLETGFLKVKLLHSIAIEEYSRCPPMGGVTITEKNKSQVIGVGIVNST